MTTLKKSTLDGNSFRAALARANAILPERPIIPAMGFGLLEGGQAGRLTVVSADAMLQLSEDSF